MTSKALWGDNRKVTMAWWSHSDKYIREILDDTSNEAGKSSRMLTWMSMK